MWGELLLSGGKVKRFQAWTRERFKLVKRVAGDWFGITYIIYFVTTMFYHRASCEYTDM